MATSSPASARAGGGGAGENAQDLQVPFGEGVGTARLQFQNSDDDAPPAHRHHQAGAQPQLFGEVTLDPVVAQDVDDEERDVVPVAGARQASPDREAQAVMRHESIRDSAEDEIVAIADRDRAGLGGGHGAHRACEHGPEARVEVTARRRDPGEGHGDRLALAPGTVAIRQRPAQQS